MKPTVGLLYLATVQILNLPLERRSENESGSFYEVIRKFGEGVNEEAVAQRKFLKQLR